MKATLSLLVVLAVLVHTGFAHRHYLKHFPNPTRVPCWTGQDEDGRGGSATDCKGTAVCAGSGHNDCVNGEENEFGDDMENPWTTKSCRRDSDGDGFTNGDELGDPCCLWSWGSPPEFTTDLGHPGARASTPQSRASCNVLPQAPTSVTVEAAGQTKLKLSAVPAGSSVSCSCWYRVRVLNGTDVLVTYSAVAKADMTAARPFVVCGLPANEPDLTVEVSSRNWQGLSTVTTASAATTAGSVAGVDDATCGTSTATELSLAPYSEPTKFHAFVTAAFLLSLIAFLAASGRCRRPRQTLNRLAVSKLAAPPSNPLVNYFFDDVASLSLPQLLLCLMAAGSSAAWYFSWRPYYDDEVYVWGGAARTGRALGQAAIPLLPLFLIPISRHSVWPYMLGISIEHAVKFHRWAATSFLVLAVAHGVLLGIAYEDSAWGLDFLLSGGAQYNALAGTIAGAVYVLIAITSLPWVRRHAYGLFKVTHFAFPVALFFTVLHYGESTAWILFPAIFIILDHALILFDHVLRPTSVESFEHDGTYATLVLRKPYFRFEPGQFVFLFVPRLSLLAHPFTVSNVSTAKQEPSWLPFGITRTQGSAEEQRIVIHIKAMSPGSFSDRLCKGIDRRGKPLGDTPFISAYGPAGHPQVEFKHYDDVLFVCGGIGVTPMVSLWEDTAQHMKEAELPTSNRLVWSFRDKAVLERLRPQLERVMSRSERAQLALHRTSADVEMEAFGGAEALGGVLHRGRPNLDEMFDELVRKGALKDGERRFVGVGVCGPPQLVDAVTTLVLEKSCEQVKFHLHQESFLW